MRRRQQVGRRQCHMVCVCVWELCSFWGTLQGNTSRGGGEWYIGGVRLLMGREGVSKRAEARWRPQEVGSMDLYDE